MQKKILYFIDRVAIGGTEGQLRMLLNGLDKEHYEPHLCTLHASDPDAHFPLLPGLALPFKSFHHASLIACIHRLSRYVRRNGIQIVQTFFQDPTVLAALSKPLHSALLVGSFRDLGFWRNGKEALKMRLAYPAYSGFIANSKAVREHFVSTDNIPRGKIEVIHNGIEYDSNIICHNEQKSNREPLVGIVANLNRHVKRVDDFIRAAALVSESCPDAQFVIIGDGELRHDLELLSQSQGIRDKIRFVGRLERPLELIRSFAVGVNTSATEGFSNAVLEYMSCGVPVVVTENGGNVEMVEEGVNGFLVPVGAVQLMASRIVKLLQEATLREKMCLSNKQLVCSLFSKEQMIRSHEIYYDRLLARVGSKHG